MAAPGKRRRVIAGTQESSHMGKDVAVKALKDKSKKSPQKADPGNDGRPTKKKKTSAL